MSGNVAETLGEALRVTITSETCNVAKVRAAVIEIAQRIGFADEDVSAIALAVDEAVCNVIKHGYAGQGGQPINVMLETVRCAERVGLRITIRDRAVQVDPVEIVGRDLEDVRPGGLGTHIIKTVMDHVEYSHETPEGMRLLLLKWLNNTAGSSKSDAGQPSQEKPADD